MRGEDEGDVVMRAVIVVCAVAAAGAILFIFWIVSLAQ